MSEGTVGTAVKDVPEVLQALRDVVAEFGSDFVYRNDRGQVADGSVACQYVHRTETGEKTPGCIVGQVYFRLFGELLEGFEGTSIAGVNGAIWGNGNGKYFTERAQDVLTAAQRAQDAGHTWGSALAEAEALAETVR